MAKKRQRAIRPMSPQKGSLSSMEKKTVKRLLSMERFLTFKSQLEQEHTQHNLTARVLEKLHYSVKGSSIEFRRKRAMLEAITSYYHKAY